MYEKFLFNLSIFMKKILILIPLCSFGFFLTWCFPQTNTIPLDQELSSTLDLTWTIDTVLNAIKQQDLVTLATFVGNNWVRFSPYTYINTWSDIILSAEEIRNGLAISSTRNRGAYDGSGEPIDLWIGQYFEKFVSDADYANAPEVLYNEVSQRGNNMNNIAEIYSGKQRVEFYFPWFDPQYEGIDWKSLTLVFDYVDGKWEIIGIIHNQWTI